ncbi:hypothetical protein HMPREF1860_01086 [Prevotella amnii]|uniref:Uncharacterized protein n=1 Tax=Prevotella amnii TaxID=419005 RepID=A0A134BDL8_9BACT|nr:hypothetical protein HMPREF1860_01086 [Prevotella amnii]
MISCELIIIYYLSDILFYILCSFFLCAAKLLILCKKHKLLM